MEASTNPKYTNYGVNLTSPQIEKIINAAKLRESTIVRLQCRSDPSSAAVGSPHQIILPLTQSQINKTQKLMCYNLTLSALQLKQLGKSGGLLPLLALLPLLLGGLAAAGGISGGIASVVSAANNTRAALAAQTETERHNREIEAEIKKGAGIISDRIQDIPFLGALAPYLRKIGLGFRDCQNLISGKNAYTKYGLEAKLGHGIFLGTRGDGIFLGPQGNGLFLSPQNLNVQMHRSQACTSPNSFLDITR